MDGNVSIISSPVVAVRLTSTISSFESNRRFSRGITIAEFKSKLEIVVGVPASCMRLQLFSALDKLLLDLDDDEALLGSYPVDDDCRIHVIDRSGTQTGEFTDLSRVEKYEISEEAYEKRTDSVRSLLKQKRAGRFNEEEAVKREEKLAEKEEKEKAAAAAISTGSRCKVEVPGNPTKIGTVMYVGECATVSPNSCNCGWSVKFAHLGARVRVTELTCLPYVCMCLLWVFLLPLILCM
uniref:Ubiquitin-like domain-containing protein n=1 Tax=Denticeps clupeoides TaxID=299321 RepID=A0AAY4CFB5_9TELE